MPAWAMVLAAMSLGVLHSTGDCPGTCECKWKSGKESVLCAGRSMTGVPQHLDAGTQLLDLSNNNLTAIHEDEFSTAQLLNLQKVFLSRCSLRTLHRSAFRNLINLVDLDLSFNLLSTVPSHTFDFLPLLTELKLNGNPIATVKNNSFKSVPHLNKLDLSECRITFVEINAFAGLEHSLQWLKLDKNRMSNIRGDTVTVLGNLKGLELAGNPWNCSCGLRSLREWVLRHNIPHTISPKCIHPDRITGKQWDKLDLDEFACLPRVAAVNQEKREPEGGNVTLSCIIRSIPLPTVKWLKKEKVIANLSGLHGEGRHLFTVQVATTGTNLTITAVEMTDGGEYTCRAENKAGKAEARINLLISVKPEEPGWSTGVVIATAAVVVLFTLAVLLIICIYCLWKRQRFHTHATVPSPTDAFEMNHKTSNNYDKVILYGMDSKAETNQGRGRDLRNGYLTTTEANLSNANQGVMNMNRVQPCQSHILESISPDLHIPQVTEFRCEDINRVANPQHSPLSDQVIFTPGEKTNVIRRDIRGYVQRKPYSSFEDTDNYPDLLETDKNTLPRSGCRPRRTRTGSCGSASTSPLLPGSSDGSCDSTPMPLLDFPDPYPELDKFLKEYRNLQEQLYKMKESCENLKQENLRFKAESLGEPQTISRLMDDVYKTVEVEPLYSVYTSTAMEPLYNTTQNLLNDSLGNVLLSAALDNNNPRPENSDQYWLTRRKILNSLSESSSNSPKSLYET